MITLLTLSLSLGLVALPLIGSSESGKKSDLPNEVQIEAEVQVSPSTGRVLHSGFSPDDYRQEIVAKAYQLGGLDFLALLECENGLRTIDRTGDQGQSHGLCQLNQRWHREVYDGRRSSREYQLSIHPPREEDRLIKDDSYEKFSFRAFTLRSLDFREIKFKIDGEAMKKLVDLKALGVEKVGITLTVIE